MVSPNRVIGDENGKVIGLELDNELARPTPRVAAGRNRSRAANS